MFKEAVIAYIKGLFGVFPERIYYYFNPEGDFQDIRPYMPIEDYSLVPFIIAGILVLALLFLAIKKGITLLNSPGTIDADYRGEICVILVNLSAEAFEIQDGERICQMVIAQHAQAEWIEVEELGSTERGAGGFGHTGKH